MAQKLMYIKDVTPHTRNWSVKIRVDEKQLPRQSQSSPRKYQRLVFVDEQGTKVVATIFETDIELFRDSFQVHETYIVSKAKVNLVDIKYQLFGNQFQWIINRTTAVRRESQDLIPRSVTMPVHVQFSDFPKYLGTKKLIDIIAVVVEKRPLKTVPMDKKINTIREFAIIDPGMNPCILTLWNELALNEGELIAASPEPMPVIVATRLIVSSYNNISLSTTTSTGIMVDPLIPEAQNLKTWRDNHQSQLMFINKEKKSFHYDETKVDLALEPIFLIADAVKADDVLRFNVHVRARILDSSQTYFYMACPKCFSSTRAEYNWEFNCMRCGETHQAKPREKLSINISDKSGNLDVTLFGNNAIQMLQMNAVTVMEMEKEGVPVMIEAINKEISDQMFTMKIKKNIDQRHDGKHIRYSVLNLQQQRVSQDSQRLSTQTSSSQLNEKQKNTSQQHCNMLPCPPKHPMISVDEAIKLDNASTFLLQVKARILDETQCYFYMACPNCYSEIDASHDLEFACERCGEDNHAILREKLLINVYDNSGDMNLATFGDNAAQILEMNAKALMDIETENIPPIIEAISEKLRHRCFMIKIKKKFSADRKKQHYIVISVLPTSSVTTEDEMSMHESLDQLIQSKGKAQLIGGQEDDDDSGESADLSTLHKGSPIQSVVRKLFDSDEITYDINAEDAAETST